MVNSNILKPDYLFGVMLRNIVEIGMLSLTMTLIITTGGIDLSVGSTLVLSSMVGGLIYQATSNNFLAVLGCLLTGALCGLINAIIITKFHVSPLITTLATMYLFMGIARGISKGDSIYSYPITQALGKTSVGFIPLQVLIFFLLAFVFYLIQERTLYGRYLSAMGLNINATKYSGVNTDKMLISIYMLSGIVAAFASLVWLGRFTSIKYDAGGILNMNATMVVVLGELVFLVELDICLVQLLALIISVLNSGLTLLNIPIDTQTIVQGSILIIV